MPCALYRLKVKAGQIELDNLVLPALTELGTAKIDAGKLDDVVILNTLQKDFKKYWRGPLNCCPARLASMQVESILALSI
jgi:hypothetical protein